MTECLECRQLSEDVFDMLKVAEIAVEVDELERAAALEKADLQSAYGGFKQQIGAERVTRDSPEWDAMLRATAGEYAAYKAAKRKVYNAKRRLKAAISAAR
ncbi:hypothetical protein [Paracoccus yeei]|uniref:Uncharacterized protein n=1 Tax=Paracoccus yeei TaxID=147645 RepID=A0A2D2C132_9RHOB|nr:hypothetical protein [Paracoccus yeei]ATQ56212.1 hypothetical protein PYTT13_10595 [Paracoccus yeei]